MPMVLHHALFWKYAAYFSGLVSALLVLSGGLAGYFAYGQSNAALEDLQRAKAQSIAGEIDRFIERVRQALESSVAKFQRSASFDEPYLGIDLVALLHNQPSITELHWIGATGHERLALSRIASDASAGGRDWSNEPSFQDARAHLRYMSPVYFRGGSDPYVSLAVSRSNDGPILVAELSLKFIGEIIAQNRVGPAGVAYVVDAGGRLIAHPDISLVLGKRDFSTLSQVRDALRQHDSDAPPPSGDAHDVGGNDVVATSVQIAPLGWTVLVEQSRDQALRPVYVSIARSLALVLAGVIVAVVAGLALARRIVRPIRAMESAARAIEEGDLDQRIDVRTGDELAALGVQFNRMAERLKTSHALQETRIAERTRDLALANEAKSRFLAAASHDLRQPMHALSLFVGQLRGVVPAAAPALLDNIEHSVESLEELFEALLDLSKLDMGAVIAQPRVLPVQPLLARIVTEFAPAAELKGLVLSLVATSLWVRSDPLLLERILINVITNAIRYTREGRILVGCRRCGDNVDVAVVDTGIGIDPVHLPNVFREFYQAARAPAAGLGLGLAIVQRLARLLDHAVTVQSHPGRGTAVRVRIPRATPQAREAGANCASHQSLDGVRVLVVDDEASTREAIRGLLAQWGCDVIVAAGGNEALQRTHDRRPDVVLCDVRLADGESGLRVVDRLRGAYGPGLACAYITGESPYEHTAEARAQGDPIACKPVKPGKLRALIEHLADKE